MSSSPKKKALTPDGTNYIGSIRTDGTWGGELEANAVAMHNNVTIDIVGDNGVVLTTVGAGPQSPYRLRWQNGDHYQVVDNGNNLIHDPTGDGNCLYEALYFIVQNPNGPAVQQLSQDLAANTNNVRTDGITQMRTEAADYIETHQADLADIIGEEIAAGAKLKGKNQTSYKNYCASLLALYSVGVTPDKFTLKEESGKKKTTYQFEPRGEAQLPSKSQATIKNVQPYLPWIYKNGIFSDAPKKSTGSSSVSLAGMAIAAENIESADGATDKMIEKLIAKHNGDIQAIFMDQGGVKNAMRSAMKGVPLYDAVALTIAIVNRDTAVYSCKTNIKGKAAKAEGESQLHAERLATEAVMDAIDEENVADLYLFIYITDTKYSNFPPCESCQETVPNAVTQFFVDRNPSLSELMKSGQFVVVSNYFATEGFQAKKQEESKEETKEPEKKPKKKSR